MRIYKNKLYTVSQVPGLSGFQRWGEREISLMRGDRVRGRSLGVSAQEFRPDEWAGFEWRLDDGHIPPLQPRVTTEGAIRECLSNGATAVCTTVFKENAS